MLCTLIGAIILSINIHVGLNMHPYDDIGDASSSLRGSTSSFILVSSINALLCKYYFNLIRISYNLDTETGVLCKRNSFPTA